MRLDHADMSFRSAHWTVPELCVWIVTGDKLALNSLGASARRALKHADLVHPGSFAARDDVLAAAQDGRITISCLRPPNPGIDPPGTRDGRADLSQVFWKSAELDDATSHMESDARWCVARITASRGAREYRDLLVSRDEALKEWPERRAAATYAPTYSADKVPEEFMAWARKQSEKDTIITVDLAEDAMRGPKNDSSNRSGGMLAPGKGLSRETIRGWIGTLPSDWIAKRGTPPSRAHSV